MYPTKFWLTAYPGQPLRGPFTEDEARAAYIAERETWPRQAVWYNDPLTGGAWPCEAEWYPQPQPPRPSRPLLLIAAEEDGTVLGGWQMPAPGAGALVRQVAEMLSTREISFEVACLVQLQPAAWIVSQRRPDQVPAPYCATHQRPHWDDGDPACHWPDHAPPETCDQVTDITAGGERIAVITPAGTGSPDEGVRAGAWQAARAKTAALLGTDMSAVEVAAAGLDLAEAFRDLDRPGTQVPE